MKRSAAILGPTPPFLRWTIAAPCPFRNLEAKNQTNAAFRELRSLRAIAVGEIEDRIVDGICIHPDAAIGEIADANGFPIGEVYAAFGGQEDAEHACRECPANVPISSGELSGDPQHSKAGCFGWVPFGESSDSSPGFMRLLECVESSEQSASIVEQFEASFADVRRTLPKQIADSFLKTSPAWFGAWASGTFSREQLILLGHICTNVDCDSIAWRRLDRAVQVCCENPSLELHVDLTPAGFSDGKLWTIDASCATCGVTSPDSTCKVCGSKAAPLRQRSTKVLGFRPYLKLASILGEDATATIVSRFHQIKADR